MSILVLAFLLYIGFNLYSKNYFNFQPQGKRYSTSNDKINLFLKEKQKELVRFEPDEIELLSANVGKQKKNLFFISTPEEGIIISIYHEPFLAFKREFYSPNHQLGVIGIATSQHKYMYFLKKDHTDVFIGEKPLGTIQNGGLTIIMNKNTVARYTNEPSKYLVYLKNKPAAEIDKNIRFTELPQRMISVYGPLDTESYVWLEVLAYYLIVLNIK